MLVVKLQTVGCFSGDTTSFFLQYGYEDFPWNCNKCTHCLPHRICSASTLYGTPGVHGQPLLGNSLLTEGSCVSQYKEELWSYRCHPIDLWHHWDLSVLYYYNPSQRNFQFEIYFLEHQGTLMPIELGLPSHLSDESCTSFLCIDWALFWWHQSSHIDNTSLPLKKFLKSVRLKTWLPLNQWTKREMNLLALNTLYY